MSQVDEKGKASPSTSIVLDVRLFRASEGLGVNAPRWNARSKQTNGKHKSTICRLDRTGSGSSAEISSFKLNNLGGEFETRRRSHTLTLICATPTDPIQGERSSNIFSLFAVRANATVITWHDMFGLGRVDGSIIATEDRSGKGLTSEEEQRSNLASCCEVLNSLVPKPANEMQPNVCRLPLRLSSPEDRNAMLLPDKHGDSEEVEAS